MKTAVLNPSLERFVTGESLDSGPCLPSDVSPDINGLHFTMGKSAEISFLDWNLLMIFTLNLPLQRDAEANPCLETLFELTTQSGLRRGKFKPKRKAQIDREKPGGTTYHPHGNESVTCSHDAQYVPSESEYINEASIPAKPTNDLLNFSSLRFYDTSSQIPEIEEPLYPGETSEKISAWRRK